MVPEVDSHTIGITVVGTLVAIATFLARHQFMQLFKSIEKLFDKVDSIGERTVVLETVQHETKRRLRVLEGRDVEEQTNPGRRLPRRDSGPDES